MTRQLDGGTCLSVYLEDTNAPASTPYSNNDTSAPGAAFPKLESLVGGHSLPTAARYAAGCTGKELQVSSVVEYWS